jgi:hypothetical protein
MSEWQIPMQTAVMAVTAQLFLLVNWGGNTIVPSGSRPFLPGH